MFLEIRDIQKSFGQNDSRVQVLKGVNMQVEQGDFCVLLGPSGSGKSTLAREIGKRYGLPVLHLDTVQFEPGWQVRDREEGRQIVRTFLAEHPDGWVIDGNYTGFYQQERLEAADGMPFHHIHGAGKSGYAAMMKALAFSSSTSTPPCSSSARAFFS